MRSIVSMDWVRQQLGKDDLIVVDCRFMLGKPNAGREAYDESHIDGAIYLDLERDLSGPKSNHGGRHPLPDLGVFSIRLGQLGIDTNVTVVAYDDQGGAMASRLWWMLYFMGHKQVYVMDEGFSRWKEAGYPVSAVVPASRQERIFKPRVQSHLLICMEDVRERLGREDVVLVDSREPRRYLGLEEPIDPVAGHIPGAVNKFWKDVLSDNGSWKSAEELAELMADVPKDKEVIVYCGSGVTACPNVIALQEAGYPNVKLYAGSWSDWISYEENPVATGEE